MGGRVSVSHRAGRKAQGYQIRYTIGKYWEKKLISISESLSKNSACFWFQKSMLQEAYGSNVFVETEKANVNVQLTRVYYNVVVFQFQNVNEVHCFI